MHSASLGHKLNVEVSLVFKWAVDDSDFNPLSTCLIAVWNEQSLGFCNVGRCQCERDLSHIKLPTPILHAYCGLRESIQLA